MFGLLILNFLIFVFWFYNFEKFDDIYLINFDNVILCNYLIMLNGIFVLIKIVFYVGYEYLIIFV